MNKKIFTKLLSVMLTLCMLFTVAVPMMTAFAADGQKVCNCQNCPIIFVIGRTDIYQDPANGNYQDVFTVSDEDMVKQMAEAVLPYFAKAVFLGQWDEYYDAFCETLIPYLKGNALSKEGTVDNSTGPAWKWSRESLKDNHNSNDIYMYQYQYDSRLDPCYLADGLNDYIEAVKEVTGHSKVCVISRCVGANIALAYVQKYCVNNNYSGLDTYVLFDPAINGVDNLEAIFSGSCYLDADSIDRFANYYLEFSYLNELLKATVNLFNLNYKLDVALTMANPLLIKIVNNLVPRILRETYATLPSYWSMVGDEYYEKAKQYIFGGYEEEYAVLIDKIDYYHEHVQLEARNILLGMKNSGTNIAVIGKYGFPITPIHKEGDMQSNLVLSLKKQSFGATCAPVDGTLSDEYVKLSIANGTAKYISPDLQVDASTCLFPDNTWFIKNLQHNPFPSGVNPLLLEICRHDGQMTVTSDKNYPQYLLYNIEENSISPLTKDNCKTMNWNTNYFVALRNFFTALYNYIKDYIANRDSTE